MGRLYELSSLFSGLQNFFLFQYTEHKVCLTKIPTHSIFKLRSVIYFKICALWHAILVKKSSALLCFLDGFGIAVPVFSY